MLFDIGGTTTRVAFCADGKTISGPRVFPTPATFKEGVNLFKNIAKDKVITEAAGGIAGVLDKNKTTLTHSPHLLSWINEPIKKEFETLLNAPVYLENDAVMEGLGELHYGAGKGSDIFVFLTVGTGVGGARFVAGKLDANALGFEPGKQILSFSEKKTLEDLISGDAIEKQFGKKPSEITDPKIWEELAEMFAYGLYNSILHWSPDTVVIGGSMITKKIGIKLARVLFHLNNIPRPFPQLPEMNLRPASWSVSPRSQQSSLFRDNPPSAESSFLPLHPTSKLVGIRGYEIKLAQLGDNAGLLGSLHFLNTLVK